MTEVTVDADAIPDELKERDQWLVWDASADRKQPFKLSGDELVPASWNDPGEWHSFTEVVAAAKDLEHVGIGYVFARGNEDYPRGLYGGLDLDGCLDEDGRPKDWLPDLEPFIDAGAYIERSPSADGLHIPLVGFEPPDWWTDVHFSDSEHEGVEAVDSKFFTFTGDAIEPAGEQVAEGVDVHEWLLEAYRQVKGQLPRVGDESADRSGGDGDVPELDVRDVIGRQYEPGDRFPHPTHGSGTGKNFMVDEGGETFRCWRHSVTGNAYHILAVEEGIIECGDWKKRDLSSDTWSEIFDAARERGLIEDDRDTSGASRMRAGADGGMAVVDEGADAPEFAAALEPDSVRAIACGDDGDIPDLNDRERAAAVWEVVRRSNEVHVRVRRDNGSLWAFDGGIWKPEGERALRRAARKCLGAANYGQNVLTELKEQARADPVVEVEPDDFGLEPGQIAVENGLLDLEAAASGGAALSELRPDDLALARLPVEYDPEASYDEWSGYVDEWAEEGKADALQEYVGYCLHVGAMPIHRALLLVGSGANGKGTFLHVVRALLDEENTTSIELQTLANERDAVADFYGSIANIDDDLSGRKLGAGLGMFKKLVGGDRVRARRLYEDGFEFDATGKHLYAANEVPDVNVPDADEAFWRRWLLVEFPNHYPPSQRDPDLRHDLSEPGALSGVLNWAIEGWRRLLEQNHFTNEERYAAEKRARWQSWGDSMDKFIEECLSRDEDAENVSTQQVHQRYAAWCRENGHEPVGQQKLTNQLKNEAFDYGKKRVDGVSTRAFGALAFSDDVPGLEAAPDRDSKQTSL